MNSIFLHFMDRWNVVFLLLLILLELHHLQLLHANLISSLPNFGIFKFVMNAIIIFHLFFLSFLCTFFFGQFALNVLLGEGVDNDRSVPHVPSHLVGGREHSILMLP